MTTPPDRLAGYDDFVCRSPQRAIYCHRWWLEAAAPGAYEILTVERGGAIQAAWPLVWERRGWRRGITMPLLTQKLGILFAPDNAKYAEQLAKTHRLIAGLLDQLPRNVYVSQGFHENFTNWLPLMWRGFEQKTWYTYLLDDIAHPDMLWAQMRNTLRTDIRKAQKRCLRLRETDDIEQLYRLCLKTFLRKGLKFPVPLETIRRIDDAARQHAGRRVFIVEDPQGHSLAGSYLVYDDHCAYYLLGGVDSEWDAGGAKALADWEMIRFAGTVSRQFDFEGSVVPSIESYFRQFGARQIPYFWIRGYTAPAEGPSLVRRVKRFAARALRRLAGMLAPEYTE